MLQYISKNIIQLFDNEIEKETARLLRHQRQLGTKIVQDEVFESKDIERRGVAAFTETIFKSKKLLTKMLIEAIYRRLGRNMVDTKLKNSVDSFWRPEVHEAHGRAVECPWHGYFVSKYDFLRLFEQRGISGTIKE